MGDVYLPFIHVPLLVKKAVSGSFGLLLGLLVGISPQWVRNESAPVILKMTISDQQPSDTAMGLEGGLFLFQMNDEQVNKVRGGFERICQDFQPHKYSEHEQILVLKVSVTSSSFLKSISNNINFNRVSPSPLT